MIFATLWNLGMLFMTLIFTLIMIAMGIDLTFALIYSLCSTFAVIFALCFPRRFITTPVYNTPIPVYETTDIRTTITDTTPAEAVEEEI